jgi:hypothetical protein
MQFIVPDRSPRGRQQTLKAKVDESTILFCGRCVCKQVCTTSAPKQKKDVEVSTSFRFKCLGGRWDSNGEAITEGVP